MKLPSSIWIEGVKKSASQKDIEIQLQYTGILGNLKDVVKLTCVMIRLGNAAYRDLNFNGAKYFGHAALTYRYNGKAHLFDLLNADNFDIMEMMDGVPALQVNQLSSLINLGPWGCFTNTQYLPDNDAGYKNRLIVLARMRKIELRNQKHYSDFEYDKDFVLGPKEIRWEGVLSNPADESIKDKKLHRQITHLRCDGLVEYAYESVNIPVWQRFWWKIDVLEDNFHLQWRRGVYRRIQGANNYWDALEDHNVSSLLPPLQSSIMNYLYPTTQCGRTNPRNASTAFTNQILCDPIGHRGGN